MPTNLRSRCVSMLLRVTGLSTIAIASGGAGCPGVEGAPDGPAGSSSSAGESGVGEPTSGEPSSSDPSASDPSASDPSASDPSASDPSATDPSASDPSATDSADGGSSDTGIPGCLPSGSYVARLTASTDLYGHTPYLKLFYSPRGNADEQIEVVVHIDGTWTFTLQPRASGSGEGHAGLPALGGTIDESCAVVIDTQAEFASDTGPFGTIDIRLDGEFHEDTASASLELQGGSIPSGPITYTFEVVPPG